MKVPPKLLFLILFIPTSLCAQMVGLEWAVQTGGSWYEQGDDVDVDASGNVYNVGRFNGTVDFDPGSGITNLTGSGSSNVFIQKLDSNGNFIWAQCFQGFVYAYLNTKVDKQGNLFLFGGFKDSIDVDPGSGIYTLRSNGFIDALILKLDSGGNFLWAKSFGSGNDDFCNAIGFDSTGNIYSSGYFWLTTDFDPGPLSYSLTSNGGKDLFALKLNSAGDFLWAKSAGGQYDDFSYDIAVDAESNVYLIGNFSDSVDFDPGIGTDFLLVAGGPNIASVFCDAFILKLDSGGNYNWARQIGAAGVDEGIGIRVDSQNNVYFNGNYSISITPPFLGSSSNFFVGKMDSYGNLIWLKTTYSSNYSPQSVGAIDIDKYGNVYSMGNSPYTADFDPGLDEYILSPTGGPEIFIQKLDPFGNFIWALLLAGAGNEQSKSLKVDLQGNVYTNGFFDYSFDADPDTGHSLFMTHGNFDCFLVKLSQGVCSNFSLGIDSIVDFTCSSFGYVLGSALNGVQPYSYSWNTTPASSDSNTVILHGGIYQLTASDANGCIRKTSVQVNGPRYPGGFDLNSNLVASVASPAIPMHIWLTGFNDACSGVNGEIKLVCGSLVNFQSASPPPSLISGDTLTWNLDTINFYSSPFASQIDFLLDPVAAIGDTICFTTLITPLLGDSDSTNNIKTYCFPLINSYDPNIKEVYPKGVCENGYVLPDNLYTYTIQFQNTGNGQAYNILITDSLDQDLDLATLRVLGSSHPCNMETSSGNLVGFRFDNILLPDSTSNEPLSHGYVYFEIQSKDSLASGTEVKNRANIYFDSNPPVLTNEVRNTIVNILPSCFTAVENVSGQKSLIIFPNPSGSIIYVQTLTEGELLVFDILGKELMKLATDQNQCVIDISGFNSGIYFIKSPEGSYSKIIKN